MQFFYSSLLIDQCLKACSHHIACLSYAANTTEETWFSKINESNVSEFLKSIDIIFPMYGNIYIL